MALGLLLPLCALPVYSLPRTRWIVREMILREVGDQTDSRMKCLILQLGNLLFLSLLSPLLVYQIKLSIPTLHAVIIIKAVVLNTGCALGFCVCVCAQSCPTLCDPMNRSPPDSSVHGIFQAGILECVAISSSRGSSQARDQANISFISCTGWWILYRWAN